MRIRSTKPEFWRSKTIASLDFFTRLVLKALEAYVDDNGVGKDSIVIFCADAFPHDLAQSGAICGQVEDSLRALCERDLAVRYTVAGEPLIYVRRWKQWQYIERPNKGRYPRPDGTREYREDVDESIAAGPDVGVTITAPQQTTDCPQPAPNVPPICPQNQSGEQRNRGTEEQRKSELALVGGSGGDVEKAAARTRGSRLPDAWVPAPDVIAQMRSDHPHIDLKVEHAKFVDYWQGKAGRDARKADWNATWRNWIRRAVEQSPQPRNTSANNGIGKPTQKALGWEAAGAALLAEMDQK